ncbi:MAG: serine protease [Acidobacteriota bacterium]
MTSTLLSLLLLAFPGFINDQPIVQPQGAMIVGDILPASYGSPNPYVGSGATPTLVHSEEIYLPGATYVAPYFSRFELAPGDYVIVRSPSGHRSWTYEGFGKAELGRTDGFWGIHVTGERLVIELYAAGSRTGYGYTVGSVARGFAPLTPTKALCGADDKENAQCYSDSHPEIYSQSRAVARLLINGSGLCTGWLVGSEGHLFTNNHCMSSQNSAMNTNYEFGAEGTCGQNCPQLQCDGIIETTTGTMIQTSAALDYTLVQLSVNLTDTYGYFQLRESGPVVDERLYIPQHPGGRGKEIAVFSDDANDQTGFLEVDSIFNNGGRMMATYYGDTEGGSSGSPVVGYSDNCAVVVHSGAFGCSGLGNTGTVVNQVIGDLGANVPADAVVSSGPCTGAIGGEDIFSDGFEAGNTSAWTLTAP